MSYRKCLPLLAALGLALAAPAAFAATANSTPGAAESAVAGKKPVDPRISGETVVCKREDSTGTRLGGAKVCRTRAEWAARSAAAHEQMDRIQQVPQTH